ncbi:GNAT family N-acetyltransferase [Micromonospora sp. PLK6-60]|uniref:GNAT family N-acetyltransferase n=1 Tax=Micromonospora sp. PLK6-60 TaxID=2873383 RepID=UPI001CA6FDC6|nr:GNAT family N-acetyltransferase [Micromonospora sp. PLK6-60]MBY8873268.1 GNAT family N-acetyltransferase [Micromonospora sp. PLK6-60]
MPPRLEQITPDNVEAACALKVRPDQEHLVEPVAHSLAEAYAWGEIAWPRLVLDGDQPVAFLMGFFRIPWRPDDPADLRSGLWRLNVAADRQGRGHGRYAVGVVCAEARRRGETRVFTTWEEGPDGPEGFYLGLGFRRTGERSGDQIVGELDLTGEPARRLMALVDPHDG